MKQGCVQIYTGNGKGKTTAMLGLALRASGAGQKIYIAQFLKHGDFSELRALRFLPGITLEQFGSPKGLTMRRGVDEEDIACARRGFAAAKKALHSGEYDMVMLDEVNVAIGLGLLAEAEVAQLVEKRPANMELVLTGRGAPEQLMQQADLVTEMREIKHYYRAGVPARKGIEL